MVKAMVGGCCVCSDERGWDENPLVYCDGHGCNVAVHQACYGIVQVPKGPWFCRKCESQERIARVKCELCPSKSGALKRTDNGGWAHVVCALYIPEVRFGNVTTMEPIILASVPHERYLKMCYICEERGKESKTAHGCCMNCNKQGCRQTFHVTCAQSCGFLCEENDGQSGPTVKYVGYCQFHWNRRNKGLLDVNKTPDKGVKLKLDKDKEKKPKPRTSSESSTSSLPNKDKVVSNNALPVAITDTLVSSPSSVAVTMTMPKPRGRKPATVKTLPSPCNNLSSNDVSLKAQHSTEVKGSPLNTASPKTIPSPPVKDTPASVNTSTLVDVITVTTNSDISPVQNSKNILSTPQSLAKPVSTPSPGNAGIPKTTSQAKPLVKSGPVKKPANEVKQAAKKRPSSKSGDEPKRKVGRPLKHKTGDSKPRTASKPAKPRSQSKSKETRSPSISSQRTTPSHSVYNSITTSSPVPIHTSLPLNQSTDQYVIPQPRLAGQLENGHRIQEQANKHSNGPLQLPNSLEQLLEYQWEQGAQFLMQQASQYDVASLMSSLHQLKADNSRLENRLESLLSRRSQLLQVSSRLSASMSCTPTGTLTTTTNTSNKQPVTSKITATTISTTQITKTVAVTKTTNSVANVDIASKVTPSLLPLNNTSIESKYSALKGKNDVGKSSPIKLTTAVTSGSLLSSQTPAIQKVVTQKTVAVQPNQIKITMVQPHAPTSEKDKQKTTTAAPIAILPTAHTLPSQFLQNQQLQVLQTQAKAPQTNQGKTHKQPILLPHQTVTSQTFTTQPFPQQQLVLLMQQQQQLQQQLQRQVTDQRLTTGQNQLSAAQNKNASTTQKFIPSAMQLGYPGNFVTFSEALAGQHIDVSKAAAFTTLPLVQLDKSKGMDLDKNGAALTGEKAGKK
ncbi:protein AF-10 [Exaiptasia diaphana]|uniref:Protein AF-10 n=1 Tax=Exaiptasia diaphana TaxID=2652724 RepID=A0A913Y9K7_EXADI|nr:protein AF-10 [Exaiptasia diaphana]KXJ28256.1 Protein AF-10 [Exaiptasia diaphana]